MTTGFTFLIFVFFCIFLFQVCFKKRTTIEGFKKKKKRFKKKRFIKKGRKVLKKTRKKLCDKKTLKLKKQIRSLRKKSLQIRKTVFNNKAFKATLQGLRDLKRINLDAYKIFDSKYKRFLMRSSKNLLKKGLSFSIKKLKRIKNGYFWHRQMLINQIKSREKFFSDYVKKLEDLKEQGLDVYENELKNFNNEFKSYMENINQMKNVVEKTIRNIDDTINKKYEEETKRLRNETVMNKKKIKSITRYNNNFIMN